MKFVSFINNDTIALCFIGSVALAGVYIASENITLSALGAIGGFIGSRVISKDKEV